MGNSSFDLLASPIQNVLWDMRWEALRPIQVEAIRILLKSEQDLLISARTASGKTEAAFLPILSQIYEQPGQSVMAIYIGPLKALINDQFRRLEDLCARADIPVHRWHGDVDSGKKEKLLRQPRGVLLITPESLEASFVNRSSSLARLFQDLRFVVIDEIHSMIGRERGQQLRSQLFRLRRYTRDEFRLVGLSATIGDSIAAYRAWMRPQSPDKVTFLHDPGEKKRVVFGIHTFDTSTEVDSVSDDATTEDEGDTIPSPMIDDILKAFGGGKGLLFCNSRATVELLADSLNDACRREHRPEEFLVHHGSVSKELRLHTEEAMRGLRPATAICSASLELGIDIGSVSMVGQVDSCWSVNSLVQRLGRSGRRDAEPHCMQVMIRLRRERSDAHLVKRLYPDLLQAIALTELMRQRWVEPPGTAALDFSTLAQQILSSLAEFGGLRAEHLFQTLADQGAFQQISATMLVDVLRSLGSEKLIEQMNDGLLLLAPRGEKLVHDYDFYSAFLTPKEYVVRFDNQTIGSLPVVYLPSPGDHFLLGGRRWQTLSVEHDAILVKPASGKKPPKFMGGGGDIHSRVREEMELVVRDEEEFEYLDPLGREFLGAARAAYRQAGLLTKRLVPLGKTTCLWFTWAGTRTQRTLVHLAKRAGLDARDYDLAIEFSEPTGRVLDELSSIARQIADANSLVAGLEILGWRKFDCYLSEDLLRTAFSRDQLDIGAARERIAELRP